MASIPPSEVPAPSTEPGSPSIPGPEISPPGPDIDTPSPGYTEPGTADPQAMATASSAGERAANDTADIGNEDHMTASTGGMAGTSR